MKRIQRKKASGFFTNWVEGFFVVLLLLGFILAAVIQSPNLSYIVAFLSGAFFGKIIYHQKKDALLHYTLLTIGFMIGYTIGNLANSWILTLLFLALGIVISYTIHDRGFF